MSTNGIRKTGYVLSGVFCLSAIFNIIYLFAVPDRKAIASLYFLISALLALLLFLSARFERLVWIQPAVYGAATIMAVMEDYQGFYGLGFFAFLVLFLFRLGFFQNKKALKLFLTIAIFYVLEIFSATKAGKPILAAFFPVFFMSIFLFFLYFSYEEKLMVYLKEPKPKLSLAARGFTPLEAAYIFAIIEGKSAKEIAYDMKVTESTARNNISRAFHKLGLSDRHEFTILSLKNEIVA